MVSNNKKAFHDYFIQDKYEAGIVLTGGEVKAIRANKVNLRDSYIRIEKGEIWLLQAHVSYLETTHASFRYDEIRKRKLLMHKLEIKRLHAKVSKNGLTLVPTKIYINDKNLVKVEVALASGKQLHDKRQSLKEKDLQKESKSAIKNFAKNN